MQLQCNYDVDFMQNYGFTFNVSFYYGPHCSQVCLYTQCVVESIVLT